MAKLLREYIDFPYDKKSISESKQERRPIIVQGVIQRANTENQNKRIYGKSILEREIGNYQKAVQEGRAVGELDHPDSSVVELKNVSHVIREIWWQDNDVMGKVEILNTPKGKIVQDLMEAGVKIGISSRGVGETTKTNEGIDMVNDDFLIIGWDIVSEPSTQGAWLNLSEAKEIGAVNKSELLCKVDRLNRIVNEILKVK